MRIVQINSVYGQGSTGKITKDLHELNLSNGHESYVFYGRGKKTKEKNVKKISNIISIAIDVLKTRLFNKHSESNVFNTIKLINMLKKIQPDVIQIHNIHGYYINYKVLFEYLSSDKSKKVWLLHDQWPISGNAAYFDPKLLDWKAPNPTYLRELSKDYPSHIYLSPKSIINNHSNKEKHLKIENLTMITPSMWLEKIINESYFSGVETKVIHNGINLELFKPNNKIATSTADKIILGVANKWDRRKGLNYFVRLANDLDSNYKIILVGISTKAAKNLPVNITAINRTETVQELIHLYNSADVLVNPTLDDNFPTVNIESQACGTPVITFDTGGSGESITKDTGMIIPKGDYLSLKQAIIEWPKKNEKIIEACVNNSKNYGRKAMLDHYMELYNKN